MLIRSVATAWTLAFVVVFFVAGAGVREVLAVLEFGLVLLLAVVVVVVVVAVVRPDVGRAGGEWRSRWFAEH